MLDDINSTKHVAIIMDGNGRWAKARGHNRYWGHVRGAKAAKNIIEYSASIGLETLTLFAFSTENWRRPMDEVTFLMKLLIKQLKKEIPSLVKNNIKFKCIGDIKRLPIDAQEVITLVTESTKHCSGLNLVFALSYSGRFDITQAMKQIARNVRLGTINPEDITENTIDEFLLTAPLKAPDLIIRTSGEMRISNFMIWQSAYSEWVFTDKLWPDFTVEDFDNSLCDYSKRERRFGLTETQNPKVLNTNAF